ncbi:TIGR01777 family oxidoreductase [Tautonia sociabilis]|uniref:TIGR01777 family protein n=1 Tax=Tautonia sociabilis TaxID=2080755 RepID=A0A432MLC1_9BACT|nr:TIGR01777 family oxidoreductase [Tautonia sociabilis]RUL88202.1 TIGR01777 family protein [Tautonia sociabilis]
MRVFIAGGTGTIGTRLVRELLARGDRPVVLTRNAAAAGRRPEFEGVELIQGDPGGRGDWQRSLDGCDAVVNLAGANLFAQRWSPSVKQALRDSRVRSTEHLADAALRADRRPSVFVQGSAVGYYGDRGDEELTETSPPGDDFLALLCREWEDAARPVAEAGVRLATIRTGIVLAKGEGILGQLEPIFKWLPGGASPVGGASHPLLPASGRQWISWIHLVDLVGLFLLALDHPEASGPLNGTAPSPRRNAEFSRELARTLRRPFVPIGPPEALLRLVLGEVARVIVTGQRVLPARPMALGYEFAFPELAGALRDLLRRDRAGIAPRP